MWANYVDPLKIIFLEDLETIPALLRAEAAVGAVSHEERFAAVATPLKVAALPAPYLRVLECLGKGSRGGSPVVPEWCHVGFYVEFL